MVDVSGTGELWLTRREVAARWRVSVEWVARRCRSGELPELVTGRTHRIAMADVLAYEHAHRSDDAQRRTR